MKTKPISIRFNEEDLKIAKALSGVEKPQKLVDLLIAEYVKPMKPKAAIELPKGYMKAETPPMPEKMIGEDPLDFSARKNEWKRLYGK